MINLKSFNLFILNESANSPDIKNDFNFHKIPDDRNNYRSAQLPLDVLQNICKKKGIKTVIRLNWDDEDGKHKPDQKSVSIEDEKQGMISIGVDFHKLSSDDKKDQRKINKFLSAGNCLIHCAHGADRTGGAVGGYLKTVKPNAELDTTEKIWKYSNLYNNWNDIINNDPKDFKKKHYLGQAIKFGVDDLQNAIELAKEGKK